MMGGMRLVTRTVRAARGVAAPPAPGASAGQSAGRRTSLPPDVVADAARRLRAVALIYASVFFLVGPATALVSPSERQAFFSSALRLGPSVLSIAIALAVAWSSRRPGIASGTVLTLGLVFEIVGSYGIAAARYLDPQQEAMSRPASRGWRCGFCSSPR